MTSRRDFIRKSGLAVAAYSVMRKGTLGKVGKLAAAASGGSFKSMRPPVLKREFISEAVEEEIRKVKGGIANPELAWILENCYPNALDATVEFSMIGGRPDTFVITGDIHVMWLRGSSSQVWPYLPLAKEDPKLKTLIAGVVNRQVKCVLLDPYAEAFNFGPTGSPWDKDHTRMKPGIWERKWELDSLSFPLRLSYGYWEAAGDVSCFDADWQKAMKLTVSTFRVQQRKSGPGPYRFQRVTATPSDTLPLGGYGNPIKPVGMIAAMFRPSDDARIFLFLIPSNFFVVTALRQLSERFNNVIGDKEFAGECTSLADEVHEAIQRYPVVNYLTFGQMYAYEVDGFGDRLFMDDASTPNLLSLPYYGCVPVDDHLYQNTRSYVLSDNDTYFFKRTAGEGIGSEHVGLGKIRPLGVMMQALTSRDDEIRRCLNTLINSNAGTGFMHESFHENDPAKFTRSCFAWANTLFGGLVIKIHKEKPYLLSRSQVGFETMRNISSRKPALIFFSLIITLFLAFGNEPASAESSISVVKSIPTLDDLAGTWQNASKVLSLPAINSTQGSAQTLRDVLAVGKLSYPPITLTGSTGGLFIDGKRPCLYETRWYPYQALRKGGDGNLGIVTAVRMMYEQRGILFHVVITNNGMTARTFELGIVLSAYTSKHKSWAWQVPRDADSSSFYATKTDDGLSVLFSGPGGQMNNCFSFKEKPQTLLVNAHSGLAGWRLTLQSGESFTVNYVLTIGENKESEHELALNSARNFDTVFALVKTDWEKRWVAMFTPGNRYFSGHLPVLVTPDKYMRRMYYMSLVSLLSVYRTCFPAAPRVYVSNTPESNCTMMYFWDTREWATTLALLDPIMMKQYLTSWLSKGVNNGYAEEYLTGKLEGVWYSADDYSISMLLNDYLDVTGDTAFLSEKIGGATVLQHMDSIATHWRSLVKPGHTLADYGGTSNLLECVPTYTHEVASLNAANVWMMRRVAAIQEEMGNRKRAEGLRAMADKLLTAVLKLYVQGKGYWDCVQPDGKRVSVREVFDFTTTALTITENLSPAMREQMLHFVDAQLLTAHWMRALSWLDPAAPFSVRPDHGPIGAYCAWPAETMAAMCKFGKFGEALGFLHRCTGTTYEGPFSQSRQLIGKGYDAPVRITELGTGGAHSQTYNASNGGGFAETIIRDFFGFEPNFLTHVLVLDKQPRGFKGELLNVRQGNHVYNIISGTEGLRIFRVK